MSEVRLIDIMTVFLVRGLTVLYTVAVVWLSLYSLQALFFSLVFGRRARTQPTPAAPASWPTVTVQLPIFNERHVGRRLLAAVASLDYPHHALHIQVLDDSTDDTTSLLQTEVRRLQARGLQVEYLHRDDRRGYKAGALAAGLEQTEADFVAIFDADFVPTPDFLKRTLPFLLADPHLGFVQTRWAHLNATYSGLTGAQALALDGHFVIEQTARQQLGAFISFNGTAGIWRRACIEAAGGWQADTLCEDLDLSYRAQLQGWRGVYRPDIAVPAELPPQLLAFKRQQFRWAKGSVQTLRKLGRRVAQGASLTAPGGQPASLSYKIRLLGLLHLSGYLVHPLMLLVLLLSLPMLWLGQTTQATLGVFGLASLGPPLLFALAQRHLYADQSGGWLRRFAYFPGLMLLGIGLTLNCTQAAIEGLTGRGGAFQRTPKFHVKQQADAWTDSAYALHLDWTTVGEIVLALYALTAVVVAVLRHNLGAAPFLALYALAFGSTAAVGIWQAGRIHRRPRRPLVHRAWHAD
ncbi:MAG: glycosyltransferase [Anaerolineae bacterium]|nr:glycosyltransferase [Anaerolineae bacterium]